MSYMSAVFNPKKHSIYEPLYPEKYIGKSLPIARSSYESTFCKWCDNNTGVVQWVSEPFAIPYFDPVKKKKRRYYPDFLIKVVNKTNKITTYVIEIKPYKEVMAPRKKGSQKTKIYEATTYMTNVSKWKAASNWCTKKGWEFKILTENEIFK